MVPHKFMNQHLILAPKHQALSNDKITPYQASIDPRFNLVAIGLGSTLPWAAGNIALPPNAYV